METCFQPIKAHRLTKELFTERNEAVNAPTSFKEARTNLGIITDMVLNEHAREDLLDT